MIKSQLEEFNAYGNKLMASKQNTCIDKKWKKEWSFLKYDPSLIELIMCKLKQFELKEENNLFIRKIIEETLSLGENILRKDYYKESQKYADANLISYISVLPITEDKPKGDLDNPIITYMCRAKNGSLENGIDTSAVESYCIEYGLKEGKDVSFAFHQEWAKEENKKEFENIFIAESNIRALDIALFFKVIAQNLDIWGI